MIDLSSLVNIVVYILVVGGICWLLWWLVAYIGLPEPFAKIARVVIAVVAVIAMINLLLSMIGSPLFRIK
jgi:hypothetical protein